jgi:hypothetical protein
MQKQASQSLSSRPEEIGPVFEPGTTVLIDDAARGIIKVVSTDSLTGQIEDRTNPVSPGRKTCQVSLLTWEIKRREKTAGPKP